MALLNKTGTLCVRLTTDQKRRTLAAARIESRKRGENVTPSGLVRELAMPGIDRIIAEAGRASDKAEAEDDEPQAVKLAA